MTKLGIYEFVRMKDDERANYLWDNGSFVTSIKEGGFKLILYVLSDFYVEVKYDTSTNEIIELKPFRTAKKLESYLEKLNLNELL